MSPNRSKRPRASPSPVRVEFTHTGTRKSHHLNTGLDGSATSKHPGSRTPACKNLVFMPLARSRARAPPISIPLLESVPEAWAAPA